MSNNSLPATTKAGLSAGQAGKTGMAALETRLTNRMAAIVATGVGLTVTLVVTLLKLLS